MTDLREAFLQDIRENPADDAPRLAYADWLMENGDPERGEFIAVQCRLAVMDPLSAYLFTREPEREEFDRLSRREQELLSGPQPALYRNEIVWFNSGNGTDAWFYLFRPLWSRGFVSRVRCTLRDWLKHGPALVRRHPLEQVELSDRRPGIFALIHTGRRRGVEQSRVGWYNSGYYGRGHADELPEDLYDLLAGDKRNLGISTYGSEEDAVADLSRVLLLWGTLANP